MRTRPGRAASCVEGYSTETLKHRAFAFDGTVVADDWRRALTKAD